MGKDCSYIRLTDWFPNSVWWSIKVDHGVPKLTGWIIEQMVELFCTEQENTIIIGRLNVPKSQLDTGYLLIN